MMYSNKCNYSALNSSKSASMLPDVIVQSHFSHLYKDNEYTEELPGSSYLYHFPYLRFLQ